MRLVLDTIANQLKQRDVLFNIFMEKLYSYSLVSRIFILIFSKVCLDQPDWNTIELI